MERLTPTQYISTYLGTFVTLTFYLSQALCSKENGSRVRADRPSYRRQLYTTGYPAFDSGYYAGVKKCKMFYGFIL